MAAWSARLGVIASGVAGSVAELIRFLLFFGDTIFLVRPLPEVYHFATFATKWAVAALTVPDDFLATFRASDNREFVGHDA